MFAKRIFMVALMGLLIFSIVGCSSESSGDVTVAASVNGVEISYEKYEDLFNRIKSGYENQGLSFQGEEGEYFLDLVKEEAIETLVQQEAIIQEAKELGYSVSEEELNEEFDLIKGEFDSEEDFQGALEFNNFTEKDFKDMLNEELLIWKFIENEITEVSVSEEEVMDFYEDYVADIKAHIEETGDEMEIPSFEELEEDITAYLMKEKEGMQITSLIENVMEKSDIEVFI